MKRSTKIIIGILLTIALILGIGVWVVYSKLADERLNQVGTIITMSKIQNELEAYKSSCGKYPSSLSILLGDSVQQNDCTTYTGGKLKQRDLRDRWQNEFIYRPSENTYELISIGNLWIKGSNGVKPELVTRPR